MAKIFIGCVALINIISITEIYLLLCNVNKPNSKFKKLPDAQYFCEGQTDPVNSQKLTESIDRAWPGLCVWRVGECWKVKGIRDHPLR